MKKASILLLIVFTLTAELKAQFSEIGVLGGVSYYMGDLNPNAPFKQVMPAGGLFYRHNFNDRFSLRGTVTVAYLKADDAKSKVQAQIDRNLNFESLLVDFAITGEFNFFRYEPGDMKHPFTPFLFGGIALFKSNPKTTAADGNKYDLQPLGTEGQGTTFYPDSKKYSLTTAAIPFGIGIKANISKNFTVGLEWGMRYTFTDYLDDVSGTYASPNVVGAERGEIARELANRSNIDNEEIEGRQRGNSTTNDWYSFALISVSFNIKARPDKCPAYQ